MCSHVHLEVTRISKGGITLQASDGLLTTVSQHVSLQTAQSFVRVVTLVAPVVLLLVLQKFFWVARHLGNLHFHASNLLVVSCSGQQQGFRVTECRQSCSWKNTAGLDWIGKVKVNDIRTRPDFPKLSLAIQNFCVIHVLSILLKSSV